MARAQTPVKVEPPTNVEEAVEHEAEDEGETRCLCGEIDPPDDSGLYIQCEQCSVWQHGFCVGITEGEDSAPDKYWCEQCKPELHSLYTTDMGQRRSMYKPVQQHKRQSRHSRREEGSQPESNAEDTGDPSSQTGAPGAVVIAATTESLASPVKPIPENKTHKRQRQGRKRNGQDVKPEPEEDRRALDRRRATSYAREEKQYQLMLEKALKESRRTSQQDDIVSELIPEESLEEPGTEDTIQDVQKRRPKMATATHTASASSSEEDSRRKGRRGPHRGKARSSSQATSADAARASEIGINKSIKPRIPSQRTTMKEMRRRVSAILEFISRTQLELSQEQLEKTQLLEFVDNAEFVKRVDNIYDKCDDSLKFMDDLTRKLLFWEKRYSTEMIALGQNDFSAQVLSETGE
ncbi:LAMI_0D09802g1_1 [Lachancea mirantina]|uniref:LAMI_0D09802g1_1 n=1 Tax=Lachancea mirantina TaxID=1230905 RepID=A0A1G4JDS4_9SACH|nr:LAMI_0D09802g1_1 [Lachancea mirantina]